MDRGFYQEMLTSSLSPGPTRAGQAQPPASNTGAGSGRGTPVLLHLVLILGGPIGVMVGVLVPLLLARDPRPLVRGTADAILRFVAHLGVLAVAGFALLATGHEELAVGPLVLMAGALLTLPLLTAVRTWRTRNVFRYPLWDLVRAPRADTLPS